MQTDVFLQGGGTRLAAHLGALRAIEECGGQIAAWAGASAGSLVAAVMASGYTPAMAFDLMLETDYRQFLDMRPMSLFKGFGLCSGRQFEKWLDGVLGGMRFQDLDVPLSVVCLNIETGGPFVFSNKRTPEAKIATSVRCSISIPGIFAVGRHEKETLVDGSLSYVEPADLFPAGQNPAVTVRFVRNRTERLRTSRPLRFTAYVERLADIVFEAAERRNQQQFWTHRLPIDTGPHSLANFSISREAKQELFRAGYEQSLEILLREQFPRNEQLRPATGRLTGVC